MRSQRVLATAVAALLLAGSAGCTAGPAGPGTRDEPIPGGATTTVGSWDIALGATVPNGDELVSAAAPGNRPPAGRTYVLVPLRLTYHGSDVGEPWLDLDVRYVTGAGALFGGADSDQCGEVPGSLEYVDQMPAAATRWGNACVAVPSQEVAGGTWIVRNGGYWGWTGFFSATSDEPTGPGSRADPTAVGTTVTVGDYAIALGPTNTDAARAIRAWDEEAQAPAAGRTYVLAPVTVTFTGGSSSGEPWSDLGISFVAADGTSFGAAEQDSCGDIPDALEAAGVLPVGRPVTANVCMSVPVGQVGDGRWHVAPEGTALVWEGHFGLK